MGEMVDSVTAALAAGSVAASDRAAATLALTYANAIDEGGDLVRLGPALLAALESLGLTIRARKEKPPAPPAPNPLDELRERRARRSTG